MGTAPTPRLHRRLPALAAAAAVLCNGAPAAPAAGPGVGAASAARVADADVPPPAGLLIPVEGVAASSLRPTFNEQIGRAHV